MDTSSLPSVPTVLLILVLGLVLYLEYIGIPIIRPLYILLRRYVFRQTIGTSSSNSLSSSSLTGTSSSTGSVNTVSTTGSTAIDIENGNLSSNISVNGTTGGSNNGGSSSSSLAHEWETEDKKGPTLIGLSTTEQPLLSTSQIKSLMSHLPSKCHGRDWSLLFSTSRDGYSLSTLYSRVQGKGPTLVVLMDEQSYIFGGFASRDWNGTDLITGSIAFSTTANGMDMLSPSRRAVHELNNSPSSSSSSSFTIPSSYTVQGSYFGSGESFLFTSRPNFAVYRWTRKNNLFLLHRPDCLAFGGGGSRFGLYLDSTLERGASGTCETFANLPLASSELFRIVRVEVWGFTLPLHLQSSSLRTPSSMAAGLRAQVTQSAKQLLSLGTTNNVTKYDKINK